MHSVKTEVLLLAFVALTGIWGCERSHSARTNDSFSPPFQGSTRFDPKRAGSIQGRVGWSGAIPDIPLLSTPPDPLAGLVLRKRQLRPNPNAPEIDLTTRGVKDAVVSLRGVDLRRSKSWDIPPVVVEQRDCEYQVIQGGEARPVGIVRLGDDVELVSRDPTFYALHATGAAYFSLTFMDPGSPRKRTLYEKGIVELSSAAGYYWMRAYLHVDDHPYYAVTSGQGEFKLTQIPEGSYEMAIWLPDWHVLRHERDPESAIIARLFFKPAIQKLLRVRVCPNKTEEVAILLSAADFGPESTKESSPR